MKPEELLSIPAIAELAKLPQWVCWDWVLKEGKQAKVPVSPDNGEWIDYTDPATWRTYGQARAYSVRTGIVFRADDPYTGIDLDVCRNAESGVILPAARDLIETLDSYTEVSPSGTGVKVWVRARLPEGCRNSQAYDWERACPVKKKNGGDSVKQPEIAIYDDRRYFAVTGQHVSGTPETIEDRQKQVDELCAHLWPVKQSSQQQQRTGPLPAESLTDDQVIEKGRSAKNGAAFDRLWRGDWSTSDYPTQSQADFAFMVDLALYCQRDAVQVARIFRTSGLWTKERARKKGRNYVERSADEACKKQTESWRPPRQSHSHRTGQASEGPRQSSGRSASQEPPPRPQEPTEPVSSLVKLNALMPLLSVPDLVFTGFRRRGPMIIGNTNKGLIEWATMAELVDFSKSKVCVADRTHKYLRGARRINVRKLWDEVVPLILELSENGHALENHIKEECGDYLRLLWDCAGNPVAELPEDIIRFHENYKKPLDNYWWQKSNATTWGADTTATRGVIPECVFLAEGRAWVHLFTARRWLGVRSILGRDYPLPTFKSGLYMLDFEPPPNAVTRRSGEHLIHARFWRGPEDVLLK